MHSISRIDRYIVKRVASPLAVGLLTGLIALLLQQLIRLLDLFANRGGPGVILLKMLGDLVPQYLSVVAPAALFVAVLYTTSRLSQDGELDAILGTGLSLRRIAAPIWMLALLLTLFSAVFVGFVQPYSRYAYRALAYLVTETSWSSAIERGSFFHGFGGKTILIGEIADHGRSLFRIFVEETDANNNSVVTTAERGELTADRNTDSLVLQLHQGIQVTSNPDGTHSWTSTFKDSTIPLDVVAPEPFRPREKHSELSFWELVTAYRNADPSSAPELSSELNYRAAYVLSVLFLPLIAIPAGIVPRRRTVGARIVAGMAVLIIYSHLLQLGQNLVERDRLPAFVAIWIPFLVLAFGSIKVFSIANASIGRDPLSVLFEPVENAWTWIRGNPVEPLKPKRTA